MAETVEEQITKVEKILLEYEEGLHLNQFDIKEVDFEEDLKKIDKMSLEDIHLTMLSWGYYATGLQKQVNKHEARAWWAGKNLNMLLCKEASDYNGYTYGERRDQALVENSFARALYKLEEQSHMAVLRLKFMVQRIDYLTKSAQDFIETKRRAQYFNRNS